MIKLKKNLKTIFKLLNYYLFYFIPEKKYKEIKYKNNHIFFGYHDKMNLLNNNKVLLHKVNNLVNNYQSPSQVGYYDLLKNELITFDTTYAWSWQLGSQLQWIGDSQNVIYNTYEKNQPISKIHSFKDNSTVKSFPYHIFNTSYNGELGIFLDFIRLGKFRSGYGYNKGGINFNFDGFKLVNLKSSIIVLEYSINQICNKLGIPFEENLYLNHFVFSPDNKKISFYLIKDKKKLRFVTLIIFDFEKGIFIKLEELDQVSHLCWKNSNEILVTSSKDLKKFNLINYNLEKRNIKIIKKLSNGKDFHLMINPNNQNLLLIDYYPNFFNYQKIIVYDLKNNIVVLDKKVKSHWSNSGFNRCDLHSKWNKDGNKILIDTMKKSTRAIKIINFLSC